MTGVAGEGGSLSPVSPELALAQRLHKNLRVKSTCTCNIQTHAQVSVYFVGVLAHVYTHLCIYVCTVCLCTYSLYIDVCMYVHAGTPLGTKSSLNCPSGGVSSPETHGWREESPAPPAAKALPGLRCSPGPVSCCRRRERDPKWSTAPPEAIAGRSHRHRWLRDTPTHSHHMARVPRREASLSPVFLSN